MRAAVLLLLLAVGCAQRTHAAEPVEQPTVVERAIARSVLLSAGCTGVQVSSVQLVTAKHCVPDEAAIGDYFDGGYLSHVSEHRDFVVVMKLFPGGGKLTLRDAHVGEHVYVVGYPIQLTNGKQALTVTDGIVAGPANRSGEVRITAPVYFGNSGGGVWADDGALVGIAVSIMAMDVFEGYPMPYPAQSYMVPVNFIRGWL